MSNIPVRGAIAKSPFDRSVFGGEMNNASVFVAGRAVIDAYDFERVQDWVGIMLTPSALSAVPDLNHRVKPKIDNLPWAALIQRCSAVPFKSNGSVSNYDGYAVVPTNGYPAVNAVTASLQKALQQLGWLRSIAPSPESQAKYTRAIDWLAPILGLWSTRQGREESRRQQK
jgi:hypothetical protein